MNWTPSLIRKVVYIVAMVPPLMMISWLGLPAGINDQGGKTGGGKLARLRDQHRLSQASLGEIDMTGETMKLATLGMRGIAVSVLWMQHNHYKKTEDWDRQATTLNQLTKLQPHFLAVWEYQAHNLSYNTSVEFDRYDYRYRWVVKGIEYLMTGTQYNRNEPRLHTTVGQVIGQKIGRSDEYKQFRRLFRSDVDFHDTLNDYIDIERAKSPNGYDNWLASREWHLVAQDLVRNKGATTRGKMPLLFNSNPAMSLISYAGAIEEDFRPDEVAQRAWINASQAWNRFGNYPNHSSWGHAIVLNDMQTMYDRATEKRKDLDALVPGLREKILQEIENGANIANVDREIAARAPEDVRQDAESLVRQIDNFMLMWVRIGHYRNTVNYIYWQSRCNAESTDEAIAARRFVFDAQRLEEKGQTDKQHLGSDLGQYDTAKELYEKAWVQWAKVFDQYPDLLVTSTGDDVYRSVNRYRRMLERIKVPFPEDFVLQPLLDQFAVPSLNETDLNPKRADDDTSDDDTSDGVERGSNDAPNDGDTGDSSPSSQPDQSASDDSSPGNEE